MRLDVLRFLVLGLAVGALACTSDEAVTKPDAPIEDEDGEDEIKSIDGLDIRRYDLNRDEKPDVLKYFKTVDGEELMVRKEFDLNFDGKIDAVGASGDVRVPDDAQVVELDGGVLMPGLVDTHSHLGGVSGGDRSATLHPGVRALDGINIFDDSLWRARAGGLTTINVMPGSGHLMSGQTVYLKLRRDPTTIEDWLFCEDPTNDICGSMKMANGTNSMRDKPAHLKGRCGECDYNSVCGGCRIRAEKIHGDIWEADPACYMTDEELGIVTT